MTGDDELVERMAEALAPYTGVMSSVDAARAALAAAEARAARQQPCPFDSPDNGGLLPEDPCPVCGDLGTFDTEEPSHCVTAKYRIRTGATP